MHERYQKWVLQYKKTGFGLSKKADIFYAKNSNRINTTSPNFRVEIKLQINNLIFYREKNKCSYIFALCFFQQMRLM